jgi:hypothetical protein
MPDPDSNHDTGAAQDVVVPATSVPRKPPAEIGGRDGPEPTRYGDWEKAGRCIDF